MPREKIHLMRPFVGAEELEAIKYIFDTKFLTEGEATKKFEQEFAKYVGARYAVAVTSCTTGMELCLRALDLGIGDKIIVPDFTHPATADCVYAVGAVPLLADVDLYTYNMDVEMLEIASEQGDAVIPVSWGGNPLHEDFYSVCREICLPVIEDAACSVGAQVNGSKVGSLADMTVFSFHPRKVMTTGEGGIITTNNKGLYERLVSSKNFGSFGGSFVNWGTNGKLCNILAAVGLAQLAKLDVNLEIRIAKAKRYNDLFAGVDYISPPLIFDNTRQTFQSYCIYVHEDGWRDRLRADLAARGIETQIGTYALHLEQFFISTPRISPLVRSEMLARNLLTLPLHHELTDDDQDYVVDSIKGLLRGYET